MRLTALAAAFLTVPLAGATPVSAQFYKDKTLTLLINYGAGGNADVEARVYQIHLKKFIPGAPNIIIQHQPGAGGINAINMLGLNVGSKSDGMTLGYFTFSPTPWVSDDPSLRVKLTDFVAVGASRSWAVAYARKDTAPGLARPADIAKATKVFVGGYARPTLHDTRLRMTFELLNVPYTMVTGFQSTAVVNKAMLQNEINVSGSSLPGYQTQAVPQLIDTGVAIPLFQYPVMDGAGRPVGNPQLESQGLQRFDVVYEQAMGKPPSGPKWEAMLLMNNLGSQMQRLMVLPKGSPMEAAEALRQAFQDVAKDPAFATDYFNVTKEKPDIRRAEDVQHMIEQLYKVDPAIKQVVKDSIAEKPGEK